MQQTRSTIPYQIKTLIHNILYQNGFYQMEHKQCQEMLMLLSQRPSQDPVEIQQRVFEGIVLYHKMYQDKLGSVMASRQFEHVSMETRKIVHHIMHEFYFLHSIRAYEMFQSPFDQPNYHGLSQNSKNLFNDEMEKAKIQYMYYGHANPYQMSSLAPPPPPPQYHSGPFLPPQPTSSYPLQHAASYPNLKYQSNHPFSRGPPTRNELYQQYSSMPRKIHKTHSERQSYLPPFDLDFQVSTRKYMRPLGDKKRKTQVKNLNLTPALKKHLSQLYEPERVQVDWDEQLQGCLCRGHIIDEPIFMCGCRRICHKKCLSGIEECLQCRLKNHDPFLTHIDTVLLTYLQDWDSNVLMEEMINFKAYEREVRSKGLEIIISCVRAQETNITWPDDMLCLINDKPLFQIPALLPEHSVQRRKDTPLFLTQTVFKNKQRELTKITLGINKGEGQRRSNRQGCFMLGIFLVKIKTVQELMAEVKNRSRNRREVLPRQEFPTSSDLAVDRVSVSCLDPYSGRPIRIPVRGKNCRHTSSFDLQTYLYLMERNQHREWKCPICSCEARRLVVDQYQARVFAEMREQESQPNRVAYLSDGGIEVKHDRVLRGTEESSESEEMASEEMGSEESEEVSIES